MKMPELPWDGGCRCGKVRFRITALPLLTMVCHCTGCQRMTASAFSTTLVTPDNGFTVTQGNTVVGGLHGDQGEHNHCDWCKSWVFTRTPQAPGSINIRATMLDDARWFEPFAETYTSEALPWVKTPARISFEKFPEMSQYRDIAEAFAAESHV